MKVRLVLTWLCTLAACQSAGGGQPANDDMATDDDDDGDDTAAGCGNGILDAGEVCDGAATCDTAGGYPGTYSCESECSIQGLCVSTEYCGDGKVNGREECDPEAPGQCAGCAAHCVCEAAEWRPSLITFTDQAAAAGLKPILPTGRWMEGGAAWCDVNNDGDFDLIQTSRHGPARLYENKGNGVFQNIGEAAGFNADSAFSNGAVCLDADNDGWRDVYLTRSSDERPFRLPNALFHNNGDGTFTNMAGPLGCAGNEWSMSAAAGDFDGDGWTDLYVGNYVRQEESSPDPCWRNRLYRNRGDGSFEEVSARLGVDDLGCTLAVAFFDFDNDGDVDIRSANDFGMLVEPDKLYRNDGPGEDGNWRFTNVSDATGVSSVRINNMGVAVADYDHDGWMDTYHSNLGACVLLDFDGAKYTDRAATSGVESARPYFGPDKDDPLRVSATWGVAFADFDLDGWEDLFVSHGLLPDVELGNGVRMAPYDPSALFLNQADGTFANISVEAGLAEISSDAGRGLALADYDGDGDLDAFEAVTGAAGSSPMPHLYRNDLELGGHYLKLRLRGTRSARDAFGTRIMATLPDGEVLLREHSGGDSYLSHSAHEMHLGLGPHAQVRRLKVRWPSGVLQEWENVSAGQIVLLVEPGL